MVDALGVITGAEDEVFELTKTVALRFGGAPVPTLSVDAFTRMLEIVIVVELPAAIAGIAIPAMVRFEPLAMPGYCVEFPLTTATASVWLVLVLNTLLVIATVGDRNTDTVAVPATLAVPEAATEHVRVICGSSSVLPSERRIFVFAAAVQLAWPYAIPAKTTAEVARPSNLLKFAISSPCGFYLLESVEVLYNLSLNYNKSSRTT
jgi:hypothetical protein